MKSNLENKINLAPSWAFAVEVYASVLSNPNASVCAKREAKEELMRLARVVDNLKSEENEK